MFKQANGLVVLSIAVALASGISIAGEAEWKIQFEPMYMNVYGHDQHVLTIYEYDFDATPVVGDMTGINLDVDSGLAYRGGFQYRKGEWGWGVDILSFMTTHARQAITAAADDPLGTIDQVGFSIANREYWSVDPASVLYYNVLEDTDLAIWTVDFFGIRTLADKANSSIRMQFGLRFADFDNDYRAVVGVEDNFGTRIDASSNYGRMQGPVVGLTGEIRRGKQTIGGYIGQSLIFGEADLISMTRDFTGAFDSPTYDFQRDFRTNQDVAIPITEIRLKWGYRVSDMVAVGIGANSSAWWDVQVPPGSVPSIGGDTALQENTIIFFGLLAGVELTF